LIFYTKKSTGQGIPILPDLELRLVKSTLKKLISKYKTNNDIIEIN